MLTFEKIGDRTICIGGVGTLFHQEGFPLGMSAKRLAESGVELSWFHVIKELYYQYTSNDRLYNKILSEIQDASIEGVKVDLDKIHEFIYATYEHQCEMIFEYLFNCDRDLAKRWVGFTS